jgi:hypothetical protein
MFTALVTFFKPEPESEIDLMEANRALRERAIHIFRHPYAAPTRAPMEPKSMPLLKNKPVRREAFII